ncbi:anhydro-N-acetylmuramic acid kinase [Flavobacterium sp. NKUCC04_CG]|uniref:anhydro-N-acetylmuramic acid kinase n=1 Tax=Flavobacterium sp. NKUCC04_CG TaxID=2842121 RepID=UPI001C5A6408|nr:anhydro-N-acetylmuramic acid kinase [Flavobacterium sp. NKUCC04_CG]MBW3519756.1 anhydro-N-acetylmuramic acid kinase [Flavobacterium sp. NKUCC04_CG]
MLKNKYTVIGTMSGTSLDGIDLCYVVFDYQDNKWNSEIIHCETIAYSTAWEDRLRQAVFASEEDVKALNVEYTELLVVVYNDFMLRNNIKSVDAICSHGHTIFHRPELGYTLQIGNLANLATGTRQRVVCDFRIQDVKLGGQGAPLVPLGDALLFADYDACLNLGGFANMSYTDTVGTRLAFDIVAVNTVLNHYANKLGRSYDDGGLIARSGTVNSALLKQLNLLPFYDLPAPKSLGIEMVNALLLPIIDSFSCTVEEVLCTYVEHIAFQIARSIPEFCKNILVTGGGAYHSFLMERLRFYKPDLAIVVPDSQLINYKEALVFALLGVLRLENQVNVLASVTGAFENHSSGVVFNP